MNPPGVIKIHIMLDTEAELRQADSARQKRSVFACSEHRPRPSMVICKPLPSLESATDTEADAKSGRRSVDLHTVLTLKKKGKQSENPGKGLSNIDIHK